MDYAELDPGIREMVRKLNDAGFRTCDSGDGVSKQDMGCALPYAHVFCAVDPNLMITEVERLYSFVGEGWHVECNYSPKDGKAFLLVMDELEESA